MTSPLSLALSLSTSLLALRRWTNQTHSTCESFALDFHTMRVKINSICAPNARPQLRTTRSQWRRLVVPHLRTNCLNPTQSKLTLFNLLPIASDWWIKCWQLLRNRYAKWWREHATCMMQCTLVPNPPLSLSVRQDNLDKLTSLNDYKLSLSSSYQTLVDNSFLQKWISIIAPFGISIGSSSDSSLYKTWFTF